MDSAAVAPHIPFMTSSFGTATFARILPLLLGLALLAGCAGGAPYPPPPALMVETIPRPPVSAEPLRWQPGHWDWTGNAYTWAPGQFVPQAGTGANWVHGHWAQSGAGWVWVPGAWAL